MLTECETRHASELLAVREADMERAEKAFNEPVFLVQQRYPKRITRAMLLKICCSLVYHGELTRSKLQATRGLYDVEQ